MNATIRAMHIGDYEQTLALWKMTEGIGLSESDTCQAINAFLQRNSGMSCVTLSDDHIVGAVLCGHDGRRGYLHHLAVAQTHRNRGIARQMLDFCFMRLAEQGIMKCNIFLLADNEAGAAFWLHNGWQRRRDLLMLQKFVVVE